METNIKCSIQSMQIYDRSVLFYASETLEPQNS